MKGIFGFGKKRNQHEFSDEERSKGGAMANMRRMMKEQNEFLQLQMQQKMMEANLRKMSQDYETTTDDMPSDSLTRRLRKDIEEDALLKRWIEAKYGVDLDELEEDGQIDNADQMPQLVQDFISAWLNKKKEEHEPPKDIAQAAQAAMEKHEFSGIEENAISEIVNMFFKNADAKTKIALKGAKKSGILKADVFVKVAAEAGRRIYEKL